MQKSHLTPSQIHRLVHRKIDRKNAIPLLAHLAACEACREEIAQQEVLKGPSFLKKTQLMQSYSGEAGAVTADQDFQDLVTVVTAEDEDAKEKLLQIVSLPRSKRGLFVRNKKEFQTLGMVRRLLAEARGKFRVHPTSAEELARLAILIAGLIEEPTYPAEAIGRQKILARAYLANALRARRRFLSAQEELDRAWRELEELPYPAVHESAWLHRFQSALHRDRHAFHEAQEHALEAQHLFRRVGRLRDALWMVVAQAIALEEAGCPAEALEVLENQTEDMSEDALGLTEYFAYRSQLALTYVRLERFIQARDLLPELRRLNARHGEWNFSARLLWIQALVHQGLDQGKQARQSLLEGLRLFLAHGYWFDGALVTLDLAQLCLGQNRNSEARALAEVAAPIFEAHGQMCEALSALQIFLRAARRERANLALLTKTRDLIRGQQRKGLHR